MGHGHRGSRRARNNPVATATFYPQIARRMSHAAAATAIQQTDAPARTSHGECCGRSFQTIAAKAINPKEPIAAPRASRLAASLPRLVPSKPARSIFAFACFSTSVALAGKMAGNARKSPPSTGPYLLAITPVATVINPPKRPRKANSYHLVFCKAPKSTCMVMKKLPEPHKPNADCGSEPNCKKNRCDDDRARFESK